MSAEIVFAIKHKGNLLWTVEQIYLTIAILFFNDLLTKHSK